DMSNSNKTRRGAPAKTRAAGTRTGAAARARPATSQERFHAVAATRIQQVQEVLGEMLQWQYPADAVLSRWLRAHPKLGARDRVELADGVLDVLRHLRRYRQFAESGTGPASRRLAILGLSTIFEPAKLQLALNADEQAWLE